MAASTATLGIAQGFNYLDLSLKKESKTVSVFFDQIRMLSSPMRKKRKSNGQFTSWMNFCDTLDSCSNMSRWNTLEKIFLREEGRGNTGVVALRGPNYHI